MTDRILIFDRAVANHYASGLAAGLRAHGARVTIAGPARTPGVAGIYPRSGVAGQKLAKLADGALGAARLLGVLARERPTVLHFQWATAPNALLARTLRPLLRARIVYTVHNPVPRGSAERWQRRLVERADALIVHGPLLRAQVCERYPGSDARLATVPIGNYELAATRTPRERACRELGLDPDVPVIAFVGQIVPRKGVDTLVDAFAQHCNRGGGGTLVIAGPLYAGDPSAWRDTLGEHAARLHLEVADGDLPDALIDRVVSAATVVALPFHEASQSATVLLAMTHGRCIVSTALGEIGATLATTGITVPPRDADALADALAIADDPARADALGARARERALAEFDWHDLAQRTLAVYASAGSRATATMAEPA